MDATLPSTINAAVSRPDSRTRGIVRLPRTASTWRVLWKYEPVNTDPTTARGRVERGGIAESKEGGRIREFRDITWVSTVILMCMCVHVCTGWFWKFRRMKGDVHYREIWRMIQRLISSPFVETKIEIILPFQLYFLVFRSIYCARIKRRMGASFFSFFFFFLRLSIVRHRFV